MNTEDLRGAHYILFADEKERRAAIAVILFLQLAKIIGRQDGKQELHLGIQEMHDHFPHFARQIGLREFFPNFTVNIYGYDGERNCCPAVNVYLRAFKDESMGRLLSIGLYLFMMRETDFAELMEEVEWLTARIGIFEKLRSREQMLNAARETLVKMGAINDPTPAA